MRRQMTMGLAMICLLAVAGVATAEENVWVSAGGERHHIKGHNAMFFGDVDTVDLNDLMDGETRTFGEGDRQFTATRIGDEVTITREENGDVRKLDIVCRLGSDTCKVLVPSDDSGKVMIMIEKTRECVNDEGDCDDVDLMHMGHAGEHTIMIRKTVDCDGPEECAEVHATVEAGELHGEHAEIIIEKLGLGDAGENVFIVGEGDPHVNVIRIDDGKVMLRCPEGDTTMRIQKDEADDVFLCPKHSLPLEKLEPRKMRVKHRETSEH